MPALVEIMLVEDDDGDALLTEHHLQRDKVTNTIIRARDGEEALEMLSSGKVSPDLILLDINMPGINGHETLIKIREIEAFMRTPVIILTTSGSDEDISKSYDLKANAYIQKPVNLEQFKKVISLIDEFWLAVVKLPPNPKRPQNE